MKKSVLLSLLVFPLVLGCNNNKNNFVNPFPDDDYDKNYKVGFSFASDEKIVRSLTENEKKNINATLNDLEFSKNITKRTGAKHIRDYTRAFADQFKQGYNASNMMEDVNESVTIQIEDDKYPTRKITNNNSNKIISYTYGDIKEQEANYATRYICHIGEEETYLTADKLEETKATETEKEKNPTSINDRIVKTENGDFKRTTDRYIAEFNYSQEEIEDKKYLDDHFYISQNDYIFSPDSNCGADAQDHVILVKSSQEQYSKGEKPGVYKINDGREYKAMSNSITVTILTKVKVVEAEKEEKDRYLVTKVRKYTEDIITSDVIQPNVPVTKLDVPIPLHYEEEYYSFSIEKLKDSEKTKATLTEEDSREIAI